MNKEDVMKIINEENLSFYNLYEDRSPNYDEVGIVKDGGSWRVYTSDERGYIRTEKLFLIETEALENFLRRLRANNRYLKAI